MNNRFHLHAIEVENFRQYRQACRVDGLEPGLNVLAGPNETGKSTLLQALRAVFFERYHGTHADHFLPHGASGRPRVAVEFELAGTCYRLEKQFARQKTRGRAVLETLGETPSVLENDEVHEALARMLDFTHPRRGPSKPEHQGISGLLWVEQGRAWEGITPSETARNSLNAVFSDQVRTLLGGEHGDALHQRVRERWLEHFTAQGKPRQERQKRQEQITAIRERLEAMQAEYQSWAQNLDLLSRLQQQQRVFEREQVLQQAREALARAERDARDLDELRHAVEQAEQEHRQAEIALEQARQAHEQRGRLIEELQARESEYQRQNLRLEAQEAELEPRRQELETREQHCAHLQTERERLLRMRQLVQDHDELQRLRAELEKRRKRLELARDQEKDRRRYLAQRAALRIDREQIQQLQRLQNELDWFEASINTAATTLVHQLEDGCEISLDGSPLQGRGEHRLLQPARLDIAGMGHIEIIPGGRELGKLRVQQQARRAEFQRLLDKLGVTSLDRAQTQYQLADTYEHRAEQCQARLEGLVPEGIEALADEIEMSTARVETLEQQLAGLAPDSLPSAEELESRLNHIEAEWQTCMSQCDALRQTCNTLQAERDRIKGELRALSRELERRRRQLEEARAEQSDHTLAQNRQHAESALEEATRRLEQARRQLAEREPEHIETELDRRRRVLESLLEEERERQQQIARLEGELRAQANQGLHEQIEELRGELEYLERQHQAVEREARALDLLYRTLDRHLEQARQAIVQPLVERLLPPLRRLIPDAEPLVGTDMNLIGLYRQKQRESFETLSIGTREQLAILMRLAWADLLAEAGRPVLVILDDALVNSDDERRDVMKGILAQAARKHQILVLTCHERAYRDLGGNFVRLPERLQ